MVLPSYMTGKEKREKMAVMETAISSSLSHPNVVQTYTYAVEPVRSNTAIGDRSHASGPGADISMHDSTFSWGPDKSLPRSSSEQGSDKDSNAGGAGLCVTPRRSVIFTHIIAASAVHCDGVFVSGSMYCMLTVAGTRTGAWL
eukprot:GHUV01054290.1.p2 GENE.GHUV01054290.1~~GHUV01054290.1.p2  ORF type:complete len:143 (-),score=34.42 GHUV01054290.1:94-522(-)